MNEVDSIISKKLPDSLLLDNAEATQAYGEALAENFQTGDVIVLYGVLGSGKTQLVKGLARGLGFHGEVTSPTFTIMHQYFGGRLPIYHLDLYRLGSEEDARRAGLEDYLPSDGITVVEWPEHIESLLPKATRRYTLEVVSLNERVIKAS